jgi:hypothetical protein
MEPVLTLGELIESARTGRPPTPDDVSVTSDGRRLDTREKVLAWIDELNAARAAERGD